MKLLLLFGMKLIFFCIVVQEREEAYQRELEVARIEKEKEIARLRAQQERAKDKQAEKVNCGRLWLKKLCTSPMQMWLIAWQQLYINFLGCS